MTKRRAFLHVGLPQGGGHLIPSALVAHADDLAEAGLHLPARSADHAFRAAVEVRRDHRAWGLRRRDVEGAWADLARRAWAQTRTGGSVYVGHDQLAGAAPDEIALLLDGLAGFDVHVLVTAARPDGRLTLLPDDHDLAEVARRWAAPLAGPDRLHVVVTDRARPEQTWQRVGEVLGIDTAALPLPAETRPGPPDLGALRLTAASTGALADHDDLVEAVERWAKAIAEEGYDVRGDLGDLAPVPRSGGSSPSGDHHARTTLLTEALDETLAELARQRQRVVELEVSYATLRRKRKKLKRRLADLINA